LWAGVVPCRDLSVHMDRQTDGGDLRAYTHRQTDRFLSVHPDHFSVHTDGTTDGQKDGQTDMTRADGHD